MKADEAVEPATDPVAGVDREDAEHRRIRDGLVYCVTVFLGVRIGLWVLALAGTGLLPNAATIPNIGKIRPAIPGPVSVPGWPARAITPGVHNLFTAFERFDGLWFLRIAQHGYRSGDGSAAFFPGYPLAVRGLSWVMGGHPFAAALIVANLALLGALLVLYFLTQSELSTSAARTTVLLLCLFPTAFFFYSPYSESLFLLFALTSFWGARRDMWWVAALAGALAALTRNVGLLLVPALLVEAIQQWREGHGSPVPKILGALAPLAGTGAYLLFWQLKIGDWLAPLHQQSGWQRSGQSPLLTLWHGTRDAFRFIGLYPGGYHLVDWLIVVPVILAAAWGIVRLRPAFSVYVWLSLLVPLSYPFDGRPLMSIPRFALVMFPAFMAAADLTERRVPRTALVAASAAGLGILTLLFVNWYYIF